MRFALHEGTGVAIGPDCYRFVERVRDRKRSPVFRQIGTDVARTIPDHELEDLIGKNQVRFLNAAEIAEAEANGGAPKGPNIIFLEDIKSEWERERVQRYELYAEGWVRAGRPALSDRKLIAVILTVAREQGDQKPPCTRTLRRFIGSWLQRGCTLEGLVSQKSLCGSKAQISAPVNEIIQDVIWEEYLTLERQSVVDCHQSIRNRIVNLNNQLIPGSRRHLVPSVRQIHREIGKIDMFTVMELRHGPRAARLKFGPRYAGVDIAKHNQRWELDSTVVDLMLVDPASGLVIGRPTLTTVIDYHTRTIAGFHVGWESEGFVTFVAAMKNSVQPKTYIHELYPEIKQSWRNMGPPEYLAVDNHSAYVSEDCKTACKQLGIDLHYTPVLKPWYRPLIERFFSTITHKVFQRVPGTTFSNIFERNDEVPPETIATTTLDELRAVITAWIVDEYHYTRHRGIKTAPALVWEESTRLHATAPPPSLERMKTALAMIVERVPQHYGIEWEGLLYNSADVANLRIAPGRPDKIRIAVDNQDLSSIMMRDPGLERWVQVPLVKPRLSAGETLTFAQHSLTQQLLRDRTSEFVGSDSYDLARSHVAKFVASKRVSNALGDRRRAQRFTFTERYPAPSSPSLVNEQSSGAISDDIFGHNGETGELDAAALLHDGANPHTSGDPLNGTGEASDQHKPPEPRQSKKRPENPVSADPEQATVLVQTDDNLDLDAAATKLGVKTHWSK